jgi:hypothetical protein
MKKSYLLTGLILLAAGPGFAQMKVGAPGAPDSTAMLEITSGPSGNKGLLLPRMTTVQRNAISNPATGLMIFNTTTQEVQVNTGTPATPTWATATATANGWSVTGNSGTTPLTNFFGTTDNQPLAFRTNNTERMRLTAGGNLGLGVDSATTKLHVNNGTFRITNGSTNMPADALEVISDGAGPDHNDNITIRSFGLNTQPSFGTASARGTYASPENSQAGDNIGNVYFNAQVNGNEIGQSVISSYYLGDGTTNKSRLTFRTQSEAALVIDSSSRVGVHTGNPQQSLHVQGTARITGSSGTATTITGRNAAGDISAVAVGDGLSLTGGTLTATGSNNWGLSGNTGTDASNNYIGTADSQAVVIRTNNTEKLRVTPAGNLGVGINDPQTKLHVDSGTIRVANGSTNMSADAIEVINDGAGPDHNDNITIRSFGSNTQPSFGTASARGTYASPENSQAGDNIGNVYFNAQVNGNELAQSVISSYYLGNGTNSRSRITFRTRTQPAMTVDSSEYVGIGTVNPRQRLHVQGTARITGSSGTATTITGRNADGDISNVTIGEGLSLTGGTLTATAGGNNWGLTGNTGSNPANNFIGTADSQAVVIRTNNAEQLRVTAVGDVGVGTNNPQTKMHLNAGSFRVSSGSTPLTADAIEVINDGGGPDRNDNITIRSYGSSTKPSFGTSSSRGTVATPQNSQAGDNIGNIYFNARVNGNDQNQGIISNQYLGDGTTNKSRMVFSTSNEPAMGIDSNGNVGIGTIAPKVKLQARGALLIAADVNPSHANGALFSWNTIRANTGEAEFVNYRGTGLGGFRFYEVDPGGSTAKAIYPNNYIAYIQPGTGNYTTQSDARVKSNINTISDGLEKVMQLNPVSYDLHSNKAIKNGIVVTTGNDRTIKSVGFLAQELQKVLPEAVIVPKDPANDLYSVSYATVVPLLTKAIQELNTKVEKLEAENAQLRADAGTVTELLNRIKQLEQVVLTNNSSSNSQTAFK